MNNFFTMCKGEAKKNIRLKGTILTILGIIAFCIVTSVAFQFINDLLLPSMEQPPAQFESYDNAISFYNVNQRQLNDKKLAEKEVTKGQHRIVEYTCDYYTTFFEYLKENELPLNTPVASPNNILFLAGDSFSYSIMLMSSAFVLIAIIGISLATTSVTDEIKGGTIKLLLARPVAKSKIIASKFLTIFAYCSALILLTGIISAIIGGILYKPSGNEIVMIFGSSVAFKSTTVGIWFLTLFSMLVELATMLIFTRFIALLTRSKSVTLVIALAFLLFGSGNIVSLLSGYSMDWLLFTTVSSPIAWFSQPTYSFPIWISIFLLIFYNALFTFLSHFIFHKSEY